MGKPRDSASERLRARLEEKGWSRTRLAEALPASEAVISRWISGKRSPSLEMAYRLETVLGIPAESWIVAKAS